MSEVETVEKQPTLVELIDSKGTKMGTHGPIAFASVDLAEIRTLAEALQNEYAIASEELSTKAVEYLQVFRQMEDLQEQYDLESAEADRYARRAHAGDDLLNAIAIWLSGGVENLNDSDTAAFKAALDRVHDRPPPRVVKPRTTIITEETSPLVPLES